MSPFKIFGFGNFYSDCSGSKESTCLGIYTIYRESFALAVFYILMVIGSLSGGRVALIINRKI